MPELLIDFADKAAWDSWSRDHGGQFEALRAAVVDSVRTHGLIEPFTGLRRQPEDVVIKPGLRESISSHEMNSRKRALMLVLEAELRARRWLGRRDLRILAPEALSRAALILRGRYPHFHGTEYLPTEADRARMFPIPHMDLQRTGLPDASFDAFISGDVMEHVPDPDAAWAEIRRVLKPGGLIVSTFPFDANRSETLVRARLDDQGRVEHLAPPQYHGNPVDPAAGSLVFVLPGWDLLDRLRAGGGQAAMVLVISAKHGITSEGAPGVFVLRSSTP